MDKGQSGILNRLNMDMINWQYIEEIEINENVAAIYWTSGRVKEIRDHNTITKLSDLIEMFPDIMNDETRMQMKQMLGGQNIKTDMSEPVISRKKPPQNAAKTDIVE